MKISTLFAGSGGQGIMLIGKLMAHTAIAENLEVVFYPSYGPEMRGGTANCTVIISTNRIGSPVTDEYSSVIAMNQLSLDKFSKNIKIFGTLIYDSCLDKPQRDDIKLYPIPIEETARALKTPKVANMVALGGYLAVDNKIALDTALQNVEEVIPKHRETMIELNKKALARGYELVKHS